MPKTLIRTLFSSLLVTFGTFAKPAKALTFDHMIPSPLAPEELWSLLAAALAGDTQNGFWPTQYSTIAGQVEEDGIVAESVFGAPPVKYRLTHVIPGSRLTYSPLPGEAMQGQSHIEVIRPAQDASESGLAGSTLHWYGTYAVTSFSPVGLTIRLYEQLFFRALKKNLQTMAASKKL